ncbi:MAG: hypothetical protein K6T75_06110 [Acetobacteraceae bacterium]|nr:hypothetical protein [Acetobacteraceae bacterium]
MRRFGFLIHPLDVSDVAKKFKLAARLPARLVEGAIRLLPPVVMGHVTGVKSPLAEVEGWFVAVPLTPRQMMGLPERYVLRRIIQAGRVCERLGAEILGLGAFTSVVGDAGITVAKNLGIPVTTGNSYTVATALQGTEEAARLMGHDLTQARVAVVGATGSIGACCARILARKVRDLTLAGRSLDKLDALARQILGETGLAVRVSTDVRGTVRRSQVVLTVSSAVGPVIEPEDLLPGAVVCDVARPRDTSRRVMQRDDVLVIEGGLVEVPGRPDLKSGLGLPPGQALACMAETMILALEGRLESFTLGRELTVEQVDEITRLASKHGFGLAGFRSFERELDPGRVALIRARAAGARA